MTSTLRERTQGPDAATLRCAARATAIALVAVAGACAATSFEGPFGTEPAAVARGEALAKRSCGGCHALGPTGASNFEGAPPFRDMRYDYNAISAARQTSQWHASFAGMPPETLSLKEIGYIGAYVRSLRQARR